MNIDWVKIVSEILAGLAVVIPLIASVVKYVRQAVKEKNWKTLLVAVMSLMEQAEEKFDEGADRKQWVMAMIKASADTINYDYDADAIGALIDSLCAMAKVVNAVPDKAGE